VIKIEIEINKAKLWNMKRIENVIYFGFGLILALGFYLFSDELKIAEAWRGSAISMFITFVAVLVGINLIKEWLFTKSLKYHIDDDKLQATYQIITKTKDSARLQVVNSVDVRQSLWEKVFGFFTVEVCYGFGDSGYYFEFPYLSEKQADMLMDKIKPTGKDINIK